MGVQILELSPDPQQSKKIFRAPTGDIVCLDRSPELRGILLDITCVNPVGEQIPLKCEKEKAMFTLKSAGPYKVTWKMCVKPSDKNRNSVYVVTVLADPVITNSTDLTTLPSLKVDQIAAQSHLTKCCGDIENWEDVFRVSLESGYNTVHLTPVQELGISRSSYSLHSHLKLSSSLKLNSSGGYEEDLKVLSDHLQDLHQKTGMFFITDVVWNHVSVCNRDILEHPESYYNLHNTPNLIPAYLIDRSIREFSFTLSDSSEITNLHSFYKRLSNHLVETSRKLEQLYKIDAGKMFNSKESTTDSLNDSILKRSHIDDVVKQLWQVDYSQSEYGGRVDMGVLRTFLSNREITSIPEQNSQIVTAISLFNEFVAPAAAQEVISKVTTAVVGDVKYRFIDENGPKHQFGDVPLVERYFQISDISFDKEKELDIYDRLDAERIKTCNGWTTGESISDMSKTMAYTKREIVIWGDSIKLRFGNSRQDAPWLWNYMEKYTCDMAKLFHGFRIDNCHNTALHVGEELLRAARRVRPNLYVVAELFTGCEDKDREIINRMGISSCVRELSKSGSPRQLADLIHHYGESKPCGSFINNLPSDQAVNSLPTLSMASSHPHAMLMDQTHDNPCPFDEHPLPNVLALSGLMCAAKCSIGSNRGYDELIPHHIHVVQEERQYQGVRQSHEDAIKPAKRALIKLHQWLEDNGYSETFVDQATEDVVIVTRHHPVTCSKVLVVIATCWSDTFTKTSEHTVNLPGDKVDVLLETEIRGKGSFNPHKELITGLCGVEVKIRENPESSNMVRVSRSEEKLELSFVLSPGCVVAILVHPGKSAQQALNYFNSYVLDKHTFAMELDIVCSSLDLYDLNYILYRCDEEERVDGCGGVYDIPGYGKLTYAGLVGFLHVLEEVKRENNMGHALCRNLCDGWWQAEYSVNRLKNKDINLGFFLEKVFSSLQAVPNHTRPRVFDAVISSVYSACLRQIDTLIPWLSNTERETNSWFVEQLVLTSIQMMGKVGDTGIPVSPYVKDPVVSMAAGLPHFSHGFMRCWGRDTFISLPGLLIATGRLEDARDLVVGFARTLRYGLIPNLLSERGHKPRYNCRDAVWWWCRSVKLLYDHLPSILQEPVYRLYNTDDTPVAAKSSFVCTVLDIINEVLRRHAAGIQFREENAGRQLDEHLLDAGFNMCAGVNHVTGFVRGGSKHNCGTWMDKVGSSLRAGNKGIPATPRDGSAIELVAMGYQTVSWLADLFEIGVGTTSEVTMTTGTSTRVVTLREWSKMIKDSFDEMFWSTSGYYKDTVGSESGCDEKFRPNQTFAMVIAPELFEESHLTLALRNIGAKLAGLLGMSTLCPGDEDYEPQYDTSDNGSNFRTAHGLNYHQGPEWVWCMGFYLRAKLSEFIKQDREDVVGSKEEIDQFFATILTFHRAMIAAEPYRGLTELTNGGGQHCPGSCPTQAWSSACLLEFFVEYQRDFLQSPQ